MHTLLITSVEEGIGKTAIALALARHAQDRGLDVAYMKPKGTRLRSATGKTRDEDPMLARTLLELDAEMHEMEPVVYSPTFVQNALRGQQDPAELRARVEEHFETLAAEADIVFVEGSDSLSTGSIVDLTDPDLARSLDARVVLVSGHGQVRDVDRTLTAAERFGDQLAGVLYNGVKDAALDELQEDVVPFLAGRDVRVFGELPRDPALAGVSVASLAEGLGADVLTSAAVSTDGRVERFTVGAMGRGSALDRFRRTRDAVMIASGDRSEVQTAALEASGIEALLLTGGFRPSSAVLGRAEEEDVPVILVQSDTRTTIDRVEGALRSGRTRTEEGVERMHELLAGRADVTAILDG
jgi:BioD-like phosphotransacetylase family protein